MVTAATPTNASRTAPFAIVLCFLVLCLLSHASSAERVLKVGLLYSSNGTFSTWGKTRAVTAQWLIDKEHALQDGCLNRLGIRLELHPRDIYSNPALVQPRADDLVNNVRVSYLMGSEGLTGIRSADIAAQRDVPLCLPMDATDASYLLSDQGDTRTRRYQNVFSPMTPASRYFSAFYRLAAQKGAKTVAVIYPSSPRNAAFYWIGSGGLDEAVDAGLEVVYTITFELHALNFAATPLEDELAMVDQQFANLVAADPDVLAITTPNGCDTFVQMTRKYRWRPKGAIISECLNQINTGSRPVFRDPAGVDELRGVFVPAQWHQDLIGRQFSDDPDRDYAKTFPYKAGRSAVGAKPSAMQMYEAMEQLYASHGWAHHSLVATDILCSYALFSAACLTNSTDPTQLRMGIQATLINTFAGTLAFSAQDGLNPLKEMATLQLKWNIDPNAPGELALAINSAYEPFWPLPTFEQLKEKGSSVFPDDGSKIGLSILIALVALVIIAAISLLFVFRKRRTIRAMALPLSIMHLLGVLLTLASASLFGYSMTDGMCKARWLVFTLGISLSTTPLSLKLYRVWHIFKPNGPLVKLRITNEQLFVSLACTCGISAIVVSVVTFMPDFTTTEVARPNIYDRSSWYVVCSYKDHAVEAAASALCAVQIAFCGIMAVISQVVGVPAMYSAALGTGMVAYTNVILGVVFGILEALSDNHSGVVVARIVLICLFALANVCFIYAYPLIMLAIYDTEVEFAESDTKSANRTRWSEDAAVLTVNHASNVPASTVEMMQTTTEKRPASTIPQRAPSQPSVPGGPPQAPKVFLAGDSE